MVASIPLIAFHAWADEDEEEETGITAGLIDKNKRYGEIDRYYKDVLTEDENNTVDAAAAWHVQDLTVELDSLTITFEDGEFYPRVAIDGNVYGAVYLGRGRWQFTTDLELEQDEMERIIKERSLDKQFSDAFLQFSPQHLAQFQEGSTAVEANEAQTKKAERYWKKRRELQPGDFDWNAAYYHVEGMEYFDLINVESNIEKVKMVMDTGTGGTGVMVYTYDADDREEVALWRYLTTGAPLDDDGTRLYNLYKSDTICHFPRKVDRENLSRRELAYKDAAVIDVQHYDADFEIYEDEHTQDWGIKGDVYVTFTPILRDLKVVPFSLITFWTNYSSYTRPLKIEFVADADGNPLPYVHRFHMLGVEMPERLAKGEQYTIRIKYDGAIIDSITQPDPEVDLSGQMDAEQAEPALSIVNYTLLNTYPWFPQNDRSFFDRYTFDWRVKVPKPLLVASSGTMVGQEDLGSHFKFIIKENVPSALASMIFGRFTMIEDDPTAGRRPHIRVYAHTGQVESAGEILEQSHDIIDYFEELFQSPYPYPEMDIAQMPFGVGFAQAPPGMVQMDGSAYLNKTFLANFYGYMDPFIREAFLPHEIGHQWFAHNICSLTDHDYWLMEAGAEYASALFGEAAAIGDGRDGDKAYTKFVKYWENRRGAKNTNNTTSLWMGATGRDQNRRRYIATIYGRGPLLMHDLRVTLGYQKVIAVLRAMLNEWQGQLVATEDFKMVLEKATGMSFDQYFDRYVYHNEKFGSVPEDEVLTPLEP